MIMSQVMKVRSGNGAAGYKLEYYCHTFITQYALDEGENQLTGAHKA